MGIFASLTLFLFFILSCEAKVFFSVDEALKKYFETCEIQEENIFLNDQQIRKVQDLIKIEVESKLLNRRKVNCKIGTSYVYFETSVVRTQRQALMIVVESNKLSFVELLAFYEPDNYIPGKKWYEFFKGIVLINKNLTPSIPNVAGATLTYNATVLAVKKIMALHQVVSTREKN